MRVSVLSSYTTDFVLREVSRLARLDGLDLELSVAPFDQFRRELLSPSPASLTFRPAAVWLSVHAAEQLREPDEFLSWVERASHVYPDATILVDNCSWVATEPLQLLEWNATGSGRARVAALNGRLASRAAALPNVRILDLEGLTARFGAERMFDPRIGYLTKSPYGAFGLARVAARLHAAFRALTGRRHKCLVLDLDGTLWGGILGEDGLEGIQVSGDGPARAFQDLQRAVLKLNNAGILLALCSKNDEAAALAALETHPDLLLRTRHFAAWRINWEDKASNLRAIAGELNLGEDSLVFLDDSPHERELVRSQLPAVAVPDLPADPAYYASFVADLPYFETLSLTQEDRDRPRLYAEDHMRESVRTQTPSLEEFLRGLGMQVRIERLGAEQCKRAAQLTQRTNQFNLSARRYTEGELRALAADPGWAGLVISARDRIGDSGMVGVALVEIGAEHARLDSLLLSCRVLGRGVEQALLYAAAELAWTAAARRLEASYVGTAKNQIVREFLLKSGFVESGGTLSRSLDELPTVPGWVEVQR